MSYVKPSESCDLSAHATIKLRVWQRPSIKIIEPRHNIPRSIAKFMYCAVYELAAVYCLRGGLRGSLWGVGRGPARYMHCAPQDMCCVPAYLMCVNISCVRMCVHKTQAICCTGPPLPHLCLMLCVL